MIEHMRWSIWLFGSATALAEIAGCAELFAIDADELLPRENDASALPKCESAQPPQQAIVPDPGQGAELWLAVRSVDFGDRIENGAPKYLQIGYDLDRTCTGHGAGPSCIEPAWATANHTDGPGGRDNAVGALLYRGNSGGLGSWTDEVNRLTSVGFLSSVIRIRGYRHVGGIDNSIDVSWYSGRLQPETGPAAWQGNDRWVVFDRWLERVSPDDASTPASETGVPPADAGASDDAYPPRYRATAAYVTTDSILVAHFREALTGSGLLAHVVLTGRLVQDSGVWALRDATFAGRIRLTEALAVFAQVTLDGGPLCTSSSDYANFKEDLCAYADISSVSDDGALPSGVSLPCDAMSLAWTFNAEAVTLVDSDRWEPFRKLLFKDCPLDASPAYDSCDSLD